MDLDKTVSIIPFSSELKEPIKTLNLAWITKYFKIEAKDEQVLSDPEGEIIDKGGMIFYAKYNNTIVGTVSLLKINGTTFELSKMAVTDEVQGQGISNKLIAHCIKTAAEQGVKKLVLYCNRKLVPAINLYLKYGFQEVSMQENLYERADIKMELTI